MAAMLIATLAPRLVFKSGAWRRGLPLLVVLIACASGARAENATPVPISIDNSVTAAPAKGDLTDPRVFNPEFYMKLYPQLHLRSDADATRDWVNNGARACRRGSFLFDAPDYLNRYRDLARGDCEAAVEHFVIAGSNEGRIGAADTCWVVFDFNYYVDPANNPDLTKAYNHPWDLVDLQLHWLQHGIAERRGASPFFNLREYQARYLDVPRSPRGAIDEYVTSGLANGRLGRASWADPAAWNALVQEAVRPQRTAAPNDAVRTFVSARGAPVKVVVKSPGWFQPALSPPWAKLNADEVCTVPPPSASDDQRVIQSFIDRMASSSKAPCRVVRLAPHAAYHIVLPANLPPSQDWVLNHLPHFHIHDAHDFVFDGNGSTLYFTGSTAAFVIENCQGGIIENLVIDWGNPFDPNPAWRGPLFEAMGTIRKDSLTAGHIELDPGTKLPPNFSPYIYTFHLWDKASGQMAREDDLPGPTDDACDAGCIAQKKQPTQAMHLRGLSLYPNGNASGRWVNSELVQFANRYVLVAFSQFQRAAVELDGSSDLRFIHCTLHASPYMGIVGGDRQRGLAFEDLSITPSQGRHISTTADGLHLTGVLGDVIVDHATFEALGDDAINLAVVWDTLGKVTSPNAFAMTGADSPAKEGDRLAFFDEMLAFVGSAHVQSASGNGTQKIQLKEGVRFLEPGLKAINMTHIPSGFYMSDVTVRRKIGRGIIFGALHGVIQDSHFENLTSSGIGFHFSSYWSEGAPSSDVAIRNNRFDHVDWSTRVYEAGAGMGTYPHRNAAITVFNEAITNYNQVPDNFEGIYPVFQDIEISGNTLQSLSGADIYIAAVRNWQEPGSTEGVLRNRFTDCGTVAQTNRMRPYFGSESHSGVVLEFVEGIPLTGNDTTAKPPCGARFDYSTSSNVRIGSH
jgi:hypothetical protein